MILLFSDCSSTREPTYLYQSSMLFKNILMRMWQVDSFGIQYLLLVHQSSFLREIWVSSLGWRLSKLSQVTIQNQYTLPLISTLLEHLSGANYFTNLDIWGDNNLVWIHQGDEWKTTLHTWYGHFCINLYLFISQMVPRFFNKLPTITLTAS